MTADKDFIFRFYLGAYHNASYEEAGEAYGCHRSNLQWKPFQLHKDQSMKSNEFEGKNVSDQSSMELSKTKS